jgi:hypothetical protein
MSVILGNLCAARIERDRPFGPGFWRSEFERIAAAFQANCCSVLSTRLLPILQIYSRARKLADDLITVEQGRSWDALDFDS